MTSEVRQRLRALAEPPPPHTLYTDDRWECSECGAHMEQDRAFGPENLRHAVSCPEGGDAPRVPRVFLKEVFGALLEMEETNTRLERELREVRAVIRGVLYTRV